MDKGNTPEDNFKLFEPDFTKKDDEIWQNIEKRIDKKPLKVSQSKAFLVRYAVAASIILAVGFSVFAGFYTKTVSVGSEDLVLSLPDGSSVDLSPSAVLRYKPYTWMITRRVELEGTGYFKVKPGSDFTVHSSLGNTTVLGTRFHIISKEYCYKVFCKSGKVSVYSKVGAKEIILTPGQETQIWASSDEMNKSITTEEKFFESEYEFFDFEGRKLSDAFLEIGEYYDIELELHSDLRNISMSAYFERYPTAEESLELICNQFDLHLIKRNERSYKISKY